MHEVMNYAAYDLDSPPDECPSTALLPLPCSFGLRDVQGLLEDSWDFVATLNRVRTYNLTSKRGNVHTSRVGGWK